MNEGVIYTLSNSSMTIYPDNTRANYINTLPRTIGVSQVGASSIWLSLESVAIENSIIPYKKSEEPDIITYDEIYQTFFIPEQCFDDTNSFVSFLQRVCVNVVFKDIYLKNGVINIQTIGKLTLISPRFLRFLGFTEYNTTNRILMLGDHYRDHRLKRYYGKYYNIDFGAQYNTLSANNPFDLNIYKPQLIKVISPSISKYVCGGGYKNVLSVIPLDHSKSALTFTPSINQYFRANTDFLSNIAIQFLDEYDRSINFSIGPPTIVKVRFKEMDNISDTFYVQISNVDSNNIYIENTHSSFVSKLPKSLQLREKWLVALTRIYLPPKILNIDNPMNILYLEIEPLENIKSSTKQIIKIEITPTLCSSIPDLLDLLNNSMSKSPVEFGKYDGKIQCIYKSEQHADESYKLKLHTKLAGMMGFVQNKLLENRGIDEYITIPLSINNEINKHSTHPQYLFEDVPNLEFSIPPWIFVYCDLVKPSIVGHTSVPLLKIIPIERKSVNNLVGRYYEFNTLEYFELENNTFQTVSIHLQTHDGHFVNFKDGASVQLTLSFSKSI